MAGLLRTGSAGASCAADHITVLDQAPAQLPEAERGNVVVCTENGGDVNLASVVAGGLQNRNPRSMDYRI